MTEAINNKLTQVQVDGVDILAGELKDRDFIK